MRSSDYPPGLTPGNFDREMGFDNGGYCDGCGEYWPHLEDHEYHGYCRQCLADITQEDTDEL